MTYPPLPSPPNTGRDLVGALDAIAYVLSTGANTSQCQWILGDPGMGDPSATPFAYVSDQSEGVAWMTAQGGQGGLGAGGSQGLDDWRGPIAITLCWSQIEYVPPIPASPVAGSPFSIGSLGVQVPYLEQPGWRSAQLLAQAIKGALRSNIVLGGWLTTTRIVETKPMLVKIGDKDYRAIRIGIDAQQRRVRGT